MGHFICGAQLRRLLYFLGVVGCILEVAVPSVFGEESESVFAQPKLLFSELKSSEPNKISAPPLASSPLASPSAKQNKIALFSGLDKITGRNVSFEVAVGEKVQFGGLYIVSSACVTRLRNDVPEEEAFVQIWEVQKKNIPPKSVFGGWMLASSPGLNTLEHPIYAIWLLKCR